MRDFAGFDIEFDNYGSTQQPGEPRQFCDEIWAALRQAGPGRREGGHAALRSAGRHVPGRPLRQGHLSRVQGARPVRRQLRQVRRDLHAGRPDRPGQHALRGHAGNRAGQAPVRRTREAARVPGAVDAERRAPADRGGQLPEGPLPAASRSATGTSRGRPRTSASRSPTARATTGTSGSTRRSATSARPAQWCERHGEQLGRLVAQPGRPRSTTSSARTSPTSTRCSGRHAQDRRLQPAGQGPHPRLPDRRRREDVEEQGHVRPGGDVPEAPRSVVPALLLRLEARAAAGRPRPEPGRVRRQGQRRPGRQGGQPGQPHRQVRRGRRACRRSIPTTAGCSPRRPRRATRSPRPTRPATSTRPCGWSWSWPTGPTRSSKPRRRGTCARTRTRPSGCRTSARSRLNLFRQLAIYLAPVLPRLARQTGELLGEPITHWDEVADAAGRHAGGAVRAHAETRREERMWMP